MNLPSRKSYAFYFILLVILGISGCLPVHLTETKCVSLWDSEKEDLSIVEERKTGYVPYLIGPEGGFKSRDEKSKFRYFLGKPKGDHEWMQNAELPWLSLECDSHSNWHRIFRFEGVDGKAPYWVAFRILNFMDSVNAGQEWKSYEIAVFDRNSLKDTIRIKTRQWTGLFFGKEYLDAWGYDEKMQTLEYDTIKGKRRYRLLSGVEEPVAPSLKSETELPFTMDCVGGEWVRSLLPLPAKLRAGWSGLTFENHPLGNYNERSIKVTIVRFQPLEPNELAPIAAAEKIAFSTFINPPHDKLMGNGFLRQSKVWGRLNGVQISSPKIEDPSFFSCMEFGVFVTMDRTPWLVVVEGRSTHQDEVLSIFNSIELK